MSSNTTGPARDSSHATDDNAGPTDSAPQQSSSAPDQPPTSSTPPPPPPTSSTPSSTPSEAPPTSSSSEPPPPPSSSSTPPPPPSSTSEPPTSSSEPPTSTPSSSSSSSSSSSTTTTPEHSTTTPSSSSSSSSSTTTTPPPTTSDSSSTSAGPTVSVTGSDPVTSYVVVTQTTSPTNTRPSGTHTTSSSTATPNGIAGKDSNGGLDQKAKVAIGVVVPIAAIAILAVIGLFFWKKRRARRIAEAERRKEVEDYAYNPNADPTIPVVGMTGGDSYEMREEGSVGYRGWGSTTLAGGSTGRKASTTISGNTNNAYSEAGPSRGNMSDAALIDGPEGEILGAMGPSAANNRGDVRRGASNASSSYSATGRSDGSDAGVGMAYGGAGGYYDQYGQSPYEAGGFGGAPGEMPAPPIIRDNPARRSTRVESPGHFPQQSAGISQNF